MCTGHVPFYNCLFFVPNLMFSPKSSPKSSPESSPESRSRVQVLYLPYLYVPLSVEFVIYIISRIMVQPKVYSKLILTILNPH